jgi:hypothetical protein
MEQDLLSFVGQGGVVDVIAINQMVMRGVIGALARSSTSWYSMYAT